MLITNVKIYTMNDADEVIDKGYILIKNGIINGIGKMEAAPSEESEIIDMKGALAYPGLIDAHNHLGVFGESSSSSDGNEDTDPITPQLRVIDAIDTDNIYFSQAVRAGITTVVVSPGSSNPIAGQISALKTSAAGCRIDDMIVKEKVAIKFALGENPKSSYYDKDQMPATRMGIAALIRETLEKASRYEKQKQSAESDGKQSDLPEYDPKNEALIPLIRREISAHFHAHTAGDIYTALRLAREFNIRAVIVHGTEGHRICSDLKNECEGVLSGPILTDISKPELKNLTPSSAGIMSANGIPVAIITDHPETPVNHLIICVAAAVRGGMDRNNALRAITSEPARICGIFDRVGSLETGKDADIVFFRDDPLNITVPSLCTIIGGKIVYSDSE